VLVRLLTRCCSCMPNPADLRARKRRGRRTLSGAAGSQGWLLGV
jgi:hypothetical protein